MKEVRTWLNKNGLGEYTSKFEEFGWDDITLLEEMTDEHIEACITKPGHKVRFKKAIARLTSGRSNFPVVENNETNICIPKVLYQRTKDAPDSWKETEDNQSALSCVPTVSNLAQSRETRNDGECKEIFKPSKGGDRAESNENSSKFADYTNKFPAEIKYTERNVAEYDDIITDTENEHDRNPSAELQLRSTEYVCNIFLILKIISSIWKTRLINVDPLKTHFYIVKPGFTGVYIICSYFFSKT